MPPIDPSIALQVKPIEIADPLQSAYKAQLLKSAMGTNEINALQQQQLRQTMAENQGIRAVIGDQANYEPHPVTGQPQLKQQAKQQLGAASPDALFKYNKDFTDQQQGWFQLQQEQQKVADAKLKHQENILTQADQLTRGQLDAYERVLNSPGGTVDKAIEEANRVGAILYQAGVKAVPELANTPLQPFDYNTAKANFAKLRTYKDYLEEQKFTQGGEDKGWVKTPLYDAEGKAYFYNTITGQKKYTGEMREQEYSQPVPGKDAAGNDVWVSGGKYAGPGGVPQMEGRSANQLFPMSKADEKPLTESETSHTGFWISMTDAKKEIDAVRKTVPSLPFTSLLIKDDAGFAAELGNMVKRGLMSADQQRAYTAYRKLVSDDVYMTSGKAITEAEWPRRWSLLVPMPNDTPEQIEQKKRFLDTEIERAKIGGGRGIERYNRQQDKPGTGAPSTPGAAPGAAAPQPKITGKTFGDDGKVDTQREAAPAAAPGPYGKREDGTEKGEGYFGTIPRTDGSNQISGELSIGVNINGKETLIPTMVPTLTKPELDFLLKADNKALFDRNNPLAVGIVEKARAHAQQRIAQGKSVWAEPGEKHPLPFTRYDFPEAKRSELREGEQTKFGNGSVWTLENGQPKQLQ